MLIQFSTYLISYSIAISIILVLVLTFGFVYLKKVKIVPINYESIIGSIKDGVIVLDKEGRIM
ncbi:MAG: hypothetical protein M1308_00385 [Actinobacteria bacterium]|nr:hypothetical protein [Actinomycetota bacterium]